MAGRLTQLEPYGLPGRRAGSFVGKGPASTHPVAKLTQLSPLGVPWERYGAFAGKPSSVPIVAVDLFLDDGSRDYEKWRYRSGRFEKFLPADRFGFARGGGGTPSRH